MSIDTHTPRFLDSAPRSRLPHLPRLLVRAPLVFGAVCCAMFEPLLRRHDTARTAHTVAKWTKRILELANVELSVEGTVPVGPGLFVSNHRSYLDILVVLAHLPVTFLCKKEVRAWPIIGHVAHNMGVVFVDRSNASSRLASLALVSAAVLEGNRIVAFPEGTTTRGPGMRATYPGLFREADRQGFTVFPMVIEYADPNDAWVDDDTLLRHVFEWLSKPVTRIKISFGPPVHAASDAAGSQRAAEEWMSAELARLNRYRW